MINTDMTFRVSRRSVWRLNIEAQLQQCSLGYRFRGRAYELTSAENPKFDLCGQPLDRTLSVGINEGVYAGLISLSEELGVPAECIGELVCSYIEANADANSGTD